MLRMRLAGMRTGQRRLQPHDLHQPRHPLVIRTAPLRIEPPRHARHAVERRLQILLVDAAHQPQVLRRLASVGGVVHARAGDLQQRALPRNREMRMTVFYPCSTFLHGCEESFFFRKSNSIFSRPISWYSGAVNASTSTVPPERPCSKQLMAFSSNCFFHCAICVACTPCREANSLKVCTPFTASSATFALNSC